MQKNEDETVRLVSVDEWREFAKSLFGGNFMRWRFVCPKCYTVSRVLDFKQYSSLGATSSSAYQECIGKYSGMGPKRLGRGCVPCGYTTNCSLNLAPIRVQKTTSSYQSFDFDCVRLVPLTGRVLKRGDIVTSVEGEGVIRGIVVDVGSFETKVRIVWDWDPVRWTIDPNVLCRAGILVDSSVLRIVESIPWP